MLVEWLMEPMVIPIILGELCSVKPDRCFIHADDNLPSTVIQVCMKDLHPQKNVEAPLRMEIIRNGKKWVLVQHTCMEDSI